MNAHDIWICPYCQSRHQDVQPGERCQQDGYWLIPDRTFQAHPEDPFLGRILADRYPMVDLLGAGGNSSVYKGLDLQSGQIVAVKIMSHLLDNSEVDHRARFFREARVLEQLTHPNIVRLLDFGEEEDGLLYMIMELVPGRSLEARIHEGGPLPPSLAAQIMLEILDALTEPHAQGLIHRDLKPANVMLDEREGRLSVKLIDFGIAKPPANTLDDIQTRAGLVLGTPMYMAPEQLQWEGVIGPFTDQYACGVILFEALSGSPPFFGSTAEIAAGHLKMPPPDLGPSTPPALRQIVTRALAKKASERFRDVREMREALSALAGRRPAPAHAHAHASPPLDEELMPTTAIRIEDAPDYMAAHGAPPPIPRAHDDFEGFADEPTRAMVDLEMM
ncbi:serine/threonine protein kinase, partial [Myxococcota bacterium]|nr:serine/threonine protein kinase [Myxococcota bacterium]